MISTLGNVLQVLAMLVALVAAASLAVGVKTRREGVVNAGYLLVFGNAVALTACVAIILLCFLTRNFSLAYVASNFPQTDSPLLPLYQVAGVWAGRQGSLLLWTWLISVFSAMVAWRRMRVTDDLSSVALAVSEVVVALFCATLVFSESNNPFIATAAQYLNEDGTLVSSAGGMNPLLLHWAMVLHPPATFIGYAGCTIPFAYAMAALITGDVSARWVELSDRVAIFSFIFLTIGMALGAVWAYVVLGWGGFWAWDAVENASLFSWLSAVAMIHSFTMYRKRGCFKRWSMFAAVIARASELSDGSVSLYDSETGRLTEVGQLAEDAWHAAYAADPSEFSALQDAWAYNNYYAVTERWLASESGGGIVMTGRADCVKGLVWSMTNLFGTGGVRYFLGLAEFSNSMTDRQMVNALVDALVENIAERYPNQTQYHKGWISRYQREREDCLAYIAEDEAGQGGSEAPAPPSEPDTPSEPEAPGNSGGIETLSAFADYDATAWYAVNPDDLVYTVSHGFMSGYADGSGEFGFERSITRGQVAVILWRMAGEPSANARDFADVDYGEFYGDAIEWARYTGVISGFSSANGPLNIFGPELTITRQELAIMLANYASKIGRVDTSTDLSAAMSMSGWNEVGSWAQAAMGWAVDKGVITGSVVNGVARLNPTGTATRAQAGVMIARLYRDILS